MSNPRSTLHALKPLGQGDSVESLTSYFCRLACSHSASTTQLSRRICDHLDFMVAQDFDWHTRHISGHREAAQRWSAALSALTSMERLDTLTYLPWRCVIAQNGLCMHRAGQFCPVCLSEDRAQGHEPYLRLAWEPKLVTVCHKHKVRLQDHCHCCGKSNVRHASAYVVPGWCTSCGEFLGHELPEQELDPQELWRAQQVAQMVEAQQEATFALGPESLHDGLHEVIKAMHGGSSATFAKGFGIPKTTVHTWMKEGGLPTLENSLHIAHQAGMQVTQLLSNALTSWTPPRGSEQMPLLADESKKRRAPRVIDWEEVEQGLRRIVHTIPPVSVLDAAQQLGVNHRQLYLRCNATTRLLGERWQKYGEARKHANVAAVIPYLRDLADSLEEEGRALTMREAVMNVPAEVLNKVERCWDVIREVRAETLSSGTSANEERFRA